MYRYEIMWLEDIGIGYDIPKYRGFKEERLYQRWLKRVKSNPKAKLVGLIYDFQKVAI